MQTFWLCSALCIILHLFFGQDPPATPCTTPPVRDQAPWATPAAKLPPLRKKTCKSCDHPRGGVGVIGFGYKVSAHPSQPNVMQQRIPRIARQGASPQTVPATRRATPGLHNTAPCREPQSNAVSLKDQKLCLPRGEMGHSHNIPHLQEA